MALALANRVRETTTTTGTGTVTLAGAVTGYQSFSVVGNANTTYYCIAGQGTSEWEVGIGTYTLSGTTLARTTILSSSNSGSAVNFSAGTKDVFVTYPSEKSVNLDASSNLTLPGTIVGPASATVFNTVSTTVNAFGAATTLNIGSASTTAGTVYLPTVNASGAITTTNNSLSMGAGGTSAGLALFTMSGSSNAGGGPVLRMSRNSVTKWEIGTQSTFLSDGSDNINIYSASTLLLRGTQAGAVTIPVTLEVTGDVTTSGKFAKTQTAATYQQFMAVSGGTTAGAQGQVVNAGGDLRFGIASSTGASLISGAAVYSAGIWNDAAHELHLGSNSIITLTSNAAGTGITIPGTLGVTGNGAFGAATDANFRLYSVGSDNTGSNYGLVVRSANLTNTLVVSNAGAVTIPGTLGVTGATTLAAVNTTTITATGNISTKVVGTVTNLDIGDSTNANSSSRLTMSAGLNNKGWRFGVQDLVSAALTLTASTTNGGSTFTTPLLTITDAGSLQSSPASVGGTINLDLYNIVGNESDHIYAIFRLANGTVIGSIRQVTTTSAVVYNTTSDYRIKDLFGSFTTAREMLSALTVHDGQFKGSENRIPLMVAHEVQAVTPWAVTGEKDAVDDEGLPVYQQMGTGAHEALLIAGWQDHEARLVALQEEFQAYKQSHP